jgi:hypothetical protein
MNSASTQATSRQLPSTLDLVTLRPFVSLLVLRRSNRQETTEFARQLMEALASILNLDQDPRAVIARTEPSAAGELTVSSIHYQESKPAAWTLDSDIRDIINHLVLVAVRQQHVAVLITEASRSALLARRLASSDTALASVAQVRPEILNYAFARGEARTLWLSGIHRRTSTKADNKVLAGLDLRDALDPLGDQSYYFTAVRAVTLLERGATTVGVSPRRSRVWTGPSGEWSEFEQSVVSILKAIEERENKGQTDAAPIRFLAVPVTQVADVKQAFDLSVTAPELLGETEDLDDSERQELARWAYNASFIVKGTDGPDFSAQVILDGQLLGTLSVMIDLSNVNRVTCKVAANPEADHSDELAAATQMIRQRLQVRYESGHTLSDRTIFSPRYRDLPFDGWRWTKFGSIDTTREKPADANGRFTKAVANSIGANQTLFDWVWNNWPDLPDQQALTGWLACDDGSMEIADFVHFDDRRSPPMLTLIHVKGAHGGGISVSDYEVVAAQAIKNLRHLDDKLAIQALQGGNNRLISSIIWHDGVKQQGRARMLQAIQRSGMNCARRAVIVQPRVGKSDYQSARASIESGKKSGAAARLRQLDTLLAAAAQSCREFGADLYVIGNDI